MARRQFASRHLVIVVGLVAVVSIALASCGSGASTSATSTSATTPRSTAASPDTIVIQNFAFHPAMDTVRPGATITVKNEDTATHTLTAVAPHDKVFDTGDLSAGATTTFKAPTEPGTYPYICVIHQFMHGTLIVSS